MKSPINLIRRHLRKMHAYVPGEQPRHRRLLKLNTNENPFPPAPEVLEAVRQAVDERFRLYPDPVSGDLRRELARFHGVAPENVLIGNGSDDILALCIRAFVDPSDSTAAIKNPSRSLVQYFDPSYSLYPVLGSIHKATLNAYPLGDDFALPAASELRASSRWDQKAALTFITTPNAPSGCGYSTQSLQDICRMMKGVVLLDEAYAEFAEENAMSLAVSFPHVLVSRTFSKAYSLCFQRVGYVIGHPELIEALDKIRDSYNVNGIAQIAAVNTLRHHQYYADNFRIIIEEREKLSRDLAKLGFNVYPSQTNFILTEPPAGSAEAWFLQLRDLGIVVRYFKTERLERFLRISIGSPPEMKRLMTGIRKILKKFEAESGKPKTR